MRDSSRSRPARRSPTGGALALFVLFLLPLMALALLDIRQGGEDLRLEWTVVVAGLAAIGAAQVTMLALLWRRAGAAR